MPRCRLHPLHTCFIHLSPAKHQPLPPLHHHPVQHRQMQSTCAFSVAPKRCPNNIPAAAACRRRACARSRCRALHFAPHDPRHPLQAVCGTVRKVAQALRKYHHPLPHCHCWKYVFHHVRRHLHHAPCVAARAHPASLARIRYRKVLAALLAARPRKAIPQNDNVLKPPWSPRPEASDQWSTPLAMGCASSYTHGTNSMPYVFQ